MAKKDFLFELGTEELPPLALPILANALQEGLEQRLKQAGINFESCSVFATPRRLALRVLNLDARQSDQDVTKTGPSVQAAFDASGKPTKAAEGFARSCGVSVSDLTQILDGKVTKLAFHSKVVGTDSNTLLPGFITETLAELPIPKRMRWGSSREEFVRPPHWVVMLFGDEVISCNILGIPAGRITRGHRFMSSGEIVINSPAAYEDTLFKAKVIASFTKRIEIIQQQVINEAGKLQANALIDEELLAECAALVEWPVALTGSFDKEFLNVPKEALISTMKENQRCFVLFDDKRNMLPNFITISNIESNNPATVIAGNERVIRPRLADAAFFFKQDQKEHLAARIDQLKTVVFQQQLGTLFDKSQRVGAIAKAIATQLQANPTLAARAAELGKCDLLTSMVYEFPDLQGIMGSYYAIIDGEDPEVAAALNEQYMPRKAADELPHTLTGIALALAERFDTLTGLFGIGQPPSGSKDPFALRRAALGILRIIIELELPLDLADILSLAVSQHNDLPKAEGLADTILDFILERLRAWYHDKGISTDIFLSVATVRPTMPLDFSARIKAVSHFATLPQAISLSAANKRVSNLLSKSTEQINSTLLFNFEFCVDAAEISLAKAIQEIVAIVEPQLESRSYTQALTALADLQPIVDDFFNEVMVNVEDARLRNNRLALLTTLRNLFLRVADISLIQHD